MFFLLFIYEITYMVIGFFILHLSRKLLTVIANGHKQASPAFDSD